ncbi:hypothetical protein H7F15_09240 [Pontibacter sp. Tf4]|uniref:hypothetical protein n=1 Tax=Pontibacter sp. Tf4 TaxID=2761620 RepID=UPI0016248158|nr:hypothetical protein [Pontibacter sp. Tf4]MBB6611219.1 hypothetical protein [Pontibacter sp. Tf4]
MLSHHPYTSLPQVHYFYLPSQNGKPAEVIAVLNCTSDVIYIPVPEEDVELHAFFQRSITGAETRRFGDKPVWRIFNSWAELASDHQKYKVNPAVMELLLDCRTGKPLEEQYAVA